MEVQPFFGVGVPMELPEAARLKCHKGGRKRLAGGKVGRVDLVELAALARHGLRVMLQGPVNERRISGEHVTRVCGHVFGANGAVENVGVGGGDVVEDGRVKAEVFGYNIARRVCDPVIDVEGGTVRN